MELMREFGVEKVVEDKTRDLYLANEQLRTQNEGLEATVAERTADLQVALEKKLGSVLAE